MEELMKSEAIIHNRLKIKTVIENAKAYFRILKMHQI
ncbi:DNA-3-methyladenine glycosylase I [Mycoplasmopsis opalescens]